MSVIFEPSGALNVATDPARLPETGEGGVLVSQALRRCKNLSVDKTGILETRPGSSNVTANVLIGAPNFIIEQSGVRYAFAGTSIYRNELSIASGLTDAGWSAISYNQFNDTGVMVYALNGTDRKRIDGAAVYEWGIDAPTVAPTLGVGTGTGLTGAYNAKYTYLRKVGSTVVCESNPSAAATSAQSLTNQALRVTFTASTDAQVTHVRVYRTLSGGSEYYVDQDIAIGTLSVDTTTTDSNLGVIVATNHNRPPLGGLVIGPLYNGTTFIAKDNLLYWSLAKQPEYFPADNFIEIGVPQFPVKSLAAMDGQLFALTARSVHYIQGTTIGAFSPVEFETKAGAPNKFGAVGVKGRGLYHIGADGIYLLRGGVDYKITQANFEPLFRGSSVAGMQAVTNDATRWLARYENRVYFHYGNGNCLVFNMDNERVAYYKWDQKITAPAFDAENDRLIAGTIGKMIRVLEDRSVTTDAGSSIAWECESKEYTLQTRRHFPRWVKYDVDGSTATGELLLDGVVHQTHSSVGSRDTRRRLVEIGNGLRCAIRVKGTGTSDVRLIEME